MNDFSLGKWKPWGVFLNEHKPARACIEVAGLPKGVDVEIEAYSRNINIKNLVPKLRQGFFSD